MAVLLLILDVALLLCRVLQQVDMRCCSRRVVHSSSPLLLTGALGLLLPVEV